MVFGLFSACQTPRASAPPPRASAPSHFAQKTVTPEFLFQSLADRRAALKNLKSFVNSTISKKQSKHVFKQALLLKGSGSIRIETLGVFGRPLGIFIHDKNKTILYDTGQNRLYQGSEAWNIMARIVGSIADFGEYISLLSGNIPRLPELKVGAARLTSDQKRYELDAADTVRNSRYLLDIDAFTLAPIRLVKLARGQKQYIAQWEDYRNTGGYSFPHKVILTRPGEDEKLIVKFKNPVVNAGLPRDAFRFAPPPERD
ncbi:MAG: DUF4292 domain-containing protein [Nitrospinales bacterium]